MTLSLQQILKATGGKLLSDGGHAHFSMVSTDTRDLLPGSLYVPLRGERFDGHAFLAEAVAAGAAGLLVARDDLRVPAGASAVRVEDTLAAYGDLARHWREALGLKVVAVTGSSGKTSTKEMIACVLERTMRVGKSRANFNNEIGVPKTLLSMTSDDEACIVEMGMRGPGEIAYLASVARPDVGVLTNVGTAHIGRLGTQEAIAKAKGELLRVGGPAMTAVLNYDDPLVMREGADHPGLVVTYSRHDPRATIWAEGEGRTFTAHWKPGVRTQGSSCEVTLPMVGPHHQSNALAAIAVAWVLGCPLPPTLELHPEALPGRARVLAIAGVEVVDETYNANPESMRAALQGFCMDPCQGRRYAVLGDMGELGTYTEVGHRSVGDAVRAMAIDHLLTVGESSRWISEQVPGARHFEDKAALAEALVEQLKPGDRVFVKGSRSSKMEDIISALSAHFGDPHA